MPRMPRMPHHRRELAPVTTARFLRAGQQTNLGSKVTARPSSAHSRTVSSCNGCTAQVPVRYGRVLRAAGRQALNSHRSRRASRHLIIPRRLPHGAPPGRCSLVNEWHESPQAPGRPDARSETHRGHMTSAHATGWSLETHDRGLRHTQVTRMSRSTTHRRSLTSRDHAGQVTNSK